MGILAIGRVGKVREKRKSTQTTGRLKELVRVKVIKQGEFNWKNQSLASYNCGMTSKNSTVL
jgi:hypothetical protein